MTCFLFLRGSSYFLKYNSAFFSDLSFIWLNTLLNSIFYCSQLVSCETCDAIFFGEKPYHNHLLSHKEDDLIIRDPAERLVLPPLYFPLVPLVLFSFYSFLLFHRWFFFGKIGNNFGNLREWGNAIIMTVSSIDMWKIWKTRNIC